MFYQIENSEHQIIDVVEGECWVCNYKEGIARCDAVIADGIIGSDCDTIYHIAGRPSCGEGDYYVTQIDEATYTDLYDRLELGETVEIVEPIDDPGEPEVPADEPVAEQRILSRQELTDKVTELEEANAMLMECIMEMSEIVYA